MTTTDPAQGDDTLASRINDLFERDRSRGQSWTNGEVAERLRQQHPGLRVSGGYLSALRNGGRTRPSVELLSALGDFFGVSVDFFTSPGDVSAAAELVLREPGIRAIAFRAAGLNEVSLASIAAIIDNVRRLEGLPEVREDDGDDQITGRV